MRKLIAILWLLLDLVVATVELNLEDVNNWTRLEDDKTIWFSRDGRSLELKTEDKRFYDRLTHEKVKQNKNEKNYARLLAMVEESNWDLQPKQDPNSKQELMIEKDPGNRKVIRLKEKENGPNIYFYYANKDDTNAANFKNEGEKKLLKAIMNIKLNQSKNARKWFDITASEPVKMLEKNTETMHKLSLVMVVEHLLEIVRQRVLIGLTLKLVAARVRQMREQIGQHVQSMTSKLQEEVNNNLPTEMAAVRAIVLGVVGDVPADHAASETPATADTP
jgi:hypothetical protein